MDDVNYTFQDRVTQAKEEGLLAKVFYVIMSEPVSRRAVLDNLKPHIAYQRGIEKAGVMVAAGPLSDETGTEWTGRGLIIIRADSLEEANQIAAEDPMHKVGARTFKVYPWLLNEGSLRIDVRLSDQSLTLG